MAWDYAINEDNDIFVDSSGDIAQVGNKYNILDNTQVLYQDIQYALYWHNADIIALENDKVQIEAYVESLFENDSRIDSINATYDDITGDLNILINGSIEYIGNVGE